jgi:hypothetical protein
MRRRAGVSIMAGVLALVVAAPAAAQEIGQVVVTDEPSGASVALHAAATPTSQTDPGSGIEVRFFLAVTGDIASSLSVFEISEATGGYDIDGGVQGSADGAGGTLVSCTPSLQQGYPARDFVIVLTDAGGNSGTIQSRLVYTGEHVVQVQALGADARRAEIQQIYDQLLATLDVPVVAVPSGAPDLSPDPAASIPVPAVPTACLLPIPSAAPAG